MRMAGTAQFAILRRARARTLALSRVGAAQRSRHNVDVHSQDRCRLMEINHLELHMIIVDACA